MTQRLSRILGTSRWILQAVGLLLTICGLADQGRSKWTGLLWIGLPLLAIASGMPGEKPLFLCSRGEREVRASVRRAQGYRP